MQKGGRIIPEKVHLQPFRRRDEQFAKGKQLLDSGDEAGYKKLVDSIDISPDIANRLIIELKKKGIDYIVAPY